MWIRSKRPYRVVALSLLTAFLLPGCGGLVLSKEELPDTPIALSYWDSEAGRRRQDALGEAPRKTPYLYRDGVAELGMVENLFSGEHRGDVDARWPSRLMLLNPRTLELKRGPEAPVGARPLSWSNDHQRLLFSSDRVSGGRYQIFELELASGEVRPLTTGSEQHVSAAYGPDGSHVVARLGRGPSKELVAMLLVNRNRGRFESVASDVAVRQVDFAPDGSTIVYVPREIQGEENKRGSARMIVTIQAAEPGAKARAIGSGLHPTFTHDGQWVIYTAPYKGQSHLRRVRPDGTGRTGIGRSVRDEKAPAISPDGKFVIYVSPHNGLDRLFVKRFDGTGDRLLFDDGVVAWPVW